MSTGTPSDERTPFSVVVPANDLDPVPLIVKKGSIELSRRTVLLLTGITTTAFITLHQRYTSSAATISIEKDKSSKCTVATGTYDHTDFSLDCFQWENTNRYCFAQLYDGYYQCVPVGYTGDDDDDNSTTGWHNVMWYYVNPTGTCGDPCTLVRKLDGNKNR
mmetsp:Transcript_59514/g.66618  ORF Transcript_59514/g.66618 Transcript_59514/m.66618 type:complete len:162 (-) Transcript_59514:75-560(-)